MSYTTPRTWADGQEVAASALNTDLRDNIIDLNARLAAIEFSGARWTKTATQSIADSSATNVTFPSAEPYDEGGWGLTTNTIATVPAGAIPAGFADIVVGVGCFIEFANDADGRRYISLQKNGSEIAGAQWSPGANISMSMTVHTEIDAVEGDEFTVQVLHTAGAALDVNKGAFWISRRAPF